MPDLNDVDVRPDPTKIDTISPSALNRLLGCPRRLAYSRDGKTSSWQRPTTRTALGTAAHRLTESVERAKKTPPAKDMSAWLRASWDDLVAAQVHALSAAWPDRDVPPPRSWPGYATTKVRLIRGLERRIATHTGPAPDPHGSPGTGTGGQPPLPWVERRLEDAGSQLFGTPDRVEDIQGTLRVVDLKSGVHQGEINETQKRQLLIYAWLVNQTLNRLPDVLVVVDVAGREKVLAVDATEVDRVVTGAATAVHEFNAAVSGGARLQSHPAPELCRWCEFRIVCGDYWAAREDQWPSHRDIAGSVVSVTQTHVEVKPFSGEDTHRLVMTGAEIPVVGEILVAVDLESAGYATSRMKWNSRLRVQPAEPVPTGSAAPSAT
jgi:CRISPR/Cas system-associated exonuclease Cas4 (RecB family)